MSVAISALPSGWLQSSFSVPIVASHGGRRTGPDDAPKRSRRAPVNRRTLRTGARCRRLQVLHHQGSRAHEVLQGCRPLEQRPERHLLGQAMVARRAHRGPRGPLSCLSAIATTYHHRHCHHHHYHRHYHHRHHRAAKSLGTAFALSHRSTNLPLQFFFFWLVDLL